jgi:hypothetical protein
MAATDGRDRMKHFYFISRYSRPKSNRYYFMGNQRMRFGTSCRNGIENEARVAEEYWMKFVNYRSVIVSPLFVSNRAHFYAASAVT